MPQAGAAANPFHGLFGGFGDVRSSLAIMRLPVGLAGAAPGNWSWGIELAPSIGRGLITPAACAAPSFSATGPLYPTVQHEDVEFGMAAQGGLRCQVDKDLSLGISLSSPTWFHHYSWDVQNASGSPRTITYSMNLPLTAQAGINYAVTDATHLLVDVGYAAYGSASGFAHSGFNADGSLAGLGWKDAETIEAGIQQSLAEGVVVRAGFNHCSNPIPADMAFCNVGSPLHGATALCLGASFVLKAGATLDLSYARTFAVSQSGSWYTQAGAVPGTNITSTASSNEFAVGITSRF
jgi:long-chain fatty acid transport protein